MPLLKDAPPPPVSDSWTDLLHWSLRAIPTDHPDLAFLASLLGQCVERPGLTPRQAKYAQRIIERLRAEWDAGLGAPVISPQSINLAAVVPAGEA